MRGLVAILALGACAPSTWSINAPLPGWERVIQMAYREQAPCRLPWGGRIEVEPGPFTVDGRLLAGDNPANGVLRVMAYPTAAQSALAHEACHDVLFRCNRRMYEDEASACEVKVKGAL